MRCIVDGVGGERCVEGRRLPVDGGRVLILDFESMWTSDGADEGVP
jgi:hypothetical protein